MPTLDDLRDALTARETHAGDPANVQRYLDTHLGTPAARRRYLAPTVAAVAVLGIAVATTLVAAGRHSTSDHTSAATQTRQGTAVPPTAAMGQSNSAITPTSVPADALRWDFTVAALYGYTVSYDSYQSDQQSATVTPTSGHEVDAGITVYARGAFDPATGSVDGTAVTGASVTVKGNHGVFVAGPATPTLFWTYAPNSWASVSVGDTVTGQPPASSADAQALALRVADAVHFESATPITLPFQVGSLPTPLKLLNLISNAGNAAVLYGTPAGDQDIYLVVSRLAAPTTPALKKLNESARAHTGARTVSKALPDGSTLFVAVQSAHLNDISAAQQQAIADAIDVTPTLAIPNTWLTVTP